MKPTDMAVKCCLIFVIFIAFCFNGRWKTRANETIVPCPLECECSGTEFKPVYACDSRDLTNIPHFGHFAMEIDLSNNSLTVLAPQAFGNFLFLKTINLSGNQLKQLPSHAFISDINLENINLRDNLLEEIPYSELYLVKESLNTLNLGGNIINRIASNSPQPFFGMANLKELDLDENNIPELPVTIFNPLVALRKLNLDKNKIQKVPDYVFKNNSNLKEILMNDNLINHIGKRAFEDLGLCTKLQLNNNQIEKFPTESLLPLKHLKELELRNNRITQIPGNAFQENSRLLVLELRGNPIQSVGHSAFVNLPKLEYIVLSEVRELASVPNLTGTNKLQLLMLDRCAIKTVPYDMCDTQTQLQQLDLHANRLTELPNLANCTHLKVLNIGSNYITSIGKHQFAGQVELRDLDLSYNSITHIEEGAFTGLSLLETLNLGNNAIKDIHSEAFSPLSYLQTLILQDNEFPSLPSKGLRKLTRLNTINNIHLQEFPAKSNFPQIETLQLSYAYHCCPFINSDTINENESETSSKGPSIEEEIIFLYKNPDALTNGSFPLFDYEDDHMYKDLFGEDGKYDYGHNAVDDDKVLEWTEQFANNEPFAYDPKAIPGRRKITCEPKPGPFMPCVDLMDWWSLRCGVWFVFLLAIIGNGIVLVVLIASKTKMDVPRFLICNLASADFMMGIYLGFLAVVDASTLGDFRKYAIKWQMSSGCQIAGFLGTLSSELSVFTLTAITLERLYAITNAMHLEKRLSLRHAGYVMMCGWTFSITVATLPLLNIGVSDYRKFAICLPFKVGDSLSLGYVCFIMVFNMTAFIIILLCYMKIYCSIRGSQAWNSNDTRVARRMALLIFTDFVCWAPIAVLAMSAAFNASLISLNEAKVFTVFVLPLNSCANPFLYAILTKQFKKDCMDICRRLDEFTNVRKANSSLVSTMRHFSGFYKKRNSRGSQSSGMLIGLHGSCSNSSNSKRSSCLPRQVKSRSLSQDAIEQLNPTVTSGIRSRSMPNFKNCAPPFPLPVLSGSDEIVVGKYNCMSNLSTPDIMITNDQKEMFPFTDDESQEAGDIHKDSNFCCDPSCHLERKSMPSSWHGNRRKNKSTARGDYKYNLVTDYDSNSYERMHSFKSDSQMNFCFGGDEVTVPSTHTNDDPGSIGNELLPILVDCPEEYAKCRNDKENQQGIRRFLFMYQTPDGDLLPGEVKEYLCAGLPSSSIPKGSSNEEERNAQYVNLPDACDVTDNLLQDHRAGDEDTVIYINVQDQADFEGNQVEGMSQAGFLSGPKLVNVGQCRSKSENMMTTYADILSNDNNTKLDIPSSQDFKCQSQELGKCICGDEMGDTSVPLLGLNGKHVRPGGFISCSKSCDFQNHFDDIGSKGDMHEWQQTFQRDKRGLNHVNGNTMNGSGLAKGDLFDFQQNQRMSLMTEEAKGCDVVLRGERNGDNGIQDTAV